MTLLRSLGQAVDQVLQGSHLLLVHQIKLHDEVVEVLEARVQVRLLAQRHNLLKVAVVDVRVHAEQLSHTGASSLAGNQDPLIGVAD